MTRHGSGFAVAVSDQVTIGVVLALGPVDLSVFVHFADFDRKAGSALTLDTKPVVGSVQVPISPVLKGDDDRILGLVVANASQGHSTGLADQAAV